MSLALVRAAPRCRHWPYALAHAVHARRFCAEPRCAGPAPLCQARQQMARIVQGCSATPRLTPHLDVGVASHSLRAVPASAWRLAAFAVAANFCPCIHIAEQTRRWTTAWCTPACDPSNGCCHCVDVDARWNLVHATHHARRTGRWYCRTRGASIVICPATEANLGDGVFDLPGYGAAGRWSVARTATSRAAGPSCASWVQPAPDPAQAQRGRAVPGRCQQCGRLAARGLVVARPPRGWRWAALPSGSVPISVCWMRSRVRAVGTAGRARCSMPACSPAAGCRFRVRVRGWAGSAARSRRSALSRRCANCGG